MISAAKTTDRSSRSAGFTLIEIVMVLAIAAVIMGGAVGMMIYSSDERVLRDSSGEVELMAKQARTIAILHQTPYALEFRPGLIRMVPFAQAGMSDKDLSKIAGQQSRDSAAAAENRQYALPDDVNLSVRRWNSEKWLSTPKNTVHVWRFDPDGLCEPLSVRFTLGKSWAEDIYHPLTASIQESQLEAR